MIVKRRTTKIVKDTYLIMPDNNKKSNPNLAIDMFYDSGVSRSC